ncbi:DUF2789 domain-containing protein [Microbulbifer thermotolerans]|uniref:DUF2789 domain-containing protein n=1 Tax=Microbulbifer thermotolerans TaxID=252514 RepID=UPI0022497AB7|nr:DUF2789 domain-containing protein [Microbulbifer thermotolerans]MCX2794326.1 DUF2789 domain-containing protein [Microbulbifer thermotolerans]
METTGYHNLKDLFAQLGMDSEDAAIEAFLERHRLRDQEQLSDAHFWSEEQRRFLKEAILADADWREAVDELDTRLRR